jgi:hypothetical protein
LVFGLDGGFAAGLPLVTEGLRPFAPALRGLALFLGSFFFFDFAAAFGGAAT